MYDDRIKRRLIINAFPGYEFLAWGCLLHAMRANPDSRRQMVVTPEGAKFCVKHNVHGYDDPDRCSSWSITQLEGYDNEDKN